MVGAFCSAQRRQPFLLCLLALYSSTVPIAKVQGQTLSCVASTFQGPLADTKTAGDFIQVVAPDIESAEECAAFCIDSGLPLVCVLCWGVREGRTAFARSFPASSPLSMVMVEWNHTLTPLGLLAIFCNSSL